MHNRHTWSKKMPGAVCDAASVPTLQRLRRSCRAPRNERQNSLLTFCGGKAGVPRLCQEHNVKANLASLCLLSENA